MSGGGDELDPCACIIQHAMAVQRFLDILRQSQEYCTDNECFQISNLPGPTAMPHDFTMLMLMGIVAMMLYVFRPNSLRQSPIAKNRDNAGFDGEPPLPPPSIN